MRDLRYIVLISLLLGRVGVGSLFSQDYTRLSERTIIGTARYVGMSGAMTAIGGDPSAVTDNPAGLGLYRRAEAMVTMDIGIDKALVSIKLFRQGKIKQARRFVSPWRRLRRCSLSEISARMMASSPITS